MVNLLFQLTQNKIMIKGSFCPHCCFKLLREWGPLFFIHSSTTITTVRTHCNIPLVSIGIISVEGAPESDVHETHYGKEWLRCSAS